MNDKKILEWKNKILDRAKKVGLDEDEIKLLMVSTVIVNGDEKPVMFYDCYNCLEINSQDCQQCGGYKIIPAIPLNFLEPNKEYLITRR